jgi:hypothetical protein
MIEVGKKTECELSYEEAIMYCFCLGDGWRLPTKEEYCTVGSIYSWYVGRGSTWHVTPVRDLKDD